MSAANEVRQRKIPVEAVRPVVAAPAPSRNVKAKNEGPGIVKILALVLLVVSGFVAHSWYFGQKGERTFTLRQLSAYDGSNPDLPVYVSVGGDVYDVSSNKRIYGKGGAYNMIAGRDASRAFCTHCMETHLTHDLRGLTEEQLKKLDGWKDFFSKSDKYPRIGRVALPKLTDADPIPEMCDNPKMS